MLTENIALASLLSPAPAFKPERPLTSKQRAYVAHRNSGLGPKAAATAAGYSHPGVVSARLNKHPEIIAEMKKEREWRINGSLANKALVKIEWLIDNGSQAVSLAASKLVLEMAGHCAAHQPEGAATLQEQSLAEIDAAILSLQARLSAQTEALRSMAPVEEAESVEVVDDKADEGGSGEI